MTTQQTHAASPAKLRSGAWGARVQSTTVAVGDTVTITTAAGKSWQARVTQVVWSGSGVTLCATESTDRPSTPRPSSSRRRARGTWTGCSCGSVEEYERDGDCSTCRHDR